MSFYTQPDGPVLGNSSFSSSVLIPGYVLRRLCLDTSINFLITQPLDLYIIDVRSKEAFYVGPPVKDKLPKVLHPFVIQSQLLISSLRLQKDLFIAIVNLLSHFCRAFQLDLY